MLLDEVDTAHTELPRRLFSQRLGAELALFRRTSQPLACIALVLSPGESWSSIDWLTRPVMELLTTSCRPCDTVCNVGDGTFVILAPATRTSKAAHLVARVRERLHDLLTPHGVTWGIGISRPLVLGDAHPVSRAVEAAKADADRDRARHAHAAATDGHEPAETFLKKSA